MINFYRNKTLLAITKPKIASRQLDAAFSVTPYDTFDDKSKWVKSHWFSSGKAIDIEVNDIGEFTIIDNFIDGRSSLDELSLDPHITKYLKNSIKLLTAKINTTGYKHLPLYLFIRDPENRFISGLYQELYVSITNHARFMLGEEYNDGNTLYQYTNFAKETIETDSGLNFLKRYINESEISEDKKPSSKREKTFLKKIIQQWLPWFAKKTHWKSAHTDNYLIDYLLILDYMKSFKNVNLVNIEKTDVKTVFEKHIESDNEIFTLERNTSNNWLKDLLIDEIQNNPKISISIRGYLSNEMKIYNHLIKKYADLFV